MWSLLTDAYWVISRFFVFLLPLSFLGLFYGYPYAGLFADGIKNNIIEKWGVYQYISGVKDNYPDELVAATYATDITAEFPIHKLPGGYVTYPVPESKFVYVDVPTQRVWCFEDELIIAYFITSTGVQGRDTPPGYYHIGEKIRYARSRDYFEEGEIRWWGLPYYVDIGGFGFHAVPTRFLKTREPMDTLGGPASHRCIRLGYVKLDTVDGKSPAKWFYDWAEIGTPVLIRGEYDFGRDKSYPSG